MSLRLRGRLPSDGLSAALDGLLARAAERVRAVARSHRLDPASVDEVFQEVRLRIWRAFGDQGETIRQLPAAYVYQTARAAAIDLIRRRRARRSDQSDPLESVGEIATHRLADRLLLAREFGDQIEAALGELAESRRPIVRMYLQGYDREEIGRTVGWSEAKVRNLLYRGLADLREALKRRGIGPGATSE